MKNTKFTDAELTQISRAANQVWSNIAGDVLEAMGRNATVSRRDVIELVLDASRLETELKHTRGVDRGLVDRVEADIYGRDNIIEAHLKDHVFTMARYGL